MKKLALTTICAMAVAGAALAQGTVQWTTIPFGSMTAQTNSTTFFNLPGSTVFTGGATGNGTVGGTAVTYAGFYYELLYMPTTTAFGVAPTATSLFNGTWQDAGLGATNATSVGRLAVLANESNAGASVPWGNGTTNNIVMVGWSANLGTSWLSVSNELANWSTDMIANAYFGMSNVGWINPLSTGTSPGAAVFGTAVTSQGTPINSLNTQLYALPVPEPTTIALAGLGGLSLLLFRRRK